MRKLKYIIIFFCFFIFCIEFSRTPILRNRVFVLRNSILEMFYIRHDNISSYHDVKIKRIRYVNNNNFEITSCDNKLINFTLSYNVFKENRSLILLFLNKINNPILKIKKHLGDDCYLGDISGIYLGEKLSLRDYLNNNGSIYAK